MSDTEEPPSKILKLELSGAEEHLEADGDEDMMEEGQEEWLSEGVLTDDDYNPAADQESLDPSMMEAVEGNQTMEEETLQSLESSSEQLEHNDSQDWSNQNHKEQSSKVAQSETATKTTSKQNSSVSEAHKQDQCIEDTLNHLDRGSDLPDDLDAFLIRSDPRASQKSDGLVLDKKVKADEQQKPAPPEDDGNDTDDLLRMLGEDDSKGKKKVLIKKVALDKNDLYDSDDEFTYEASKMKTLKVAKSVLMKKRPASKAVPEDLSDGETTDASSEEAMTMKKMFAPTPRKHVASKSTARSSITHQQHNKHHINSKPAHSTPVKQYVNKNLQARAAKPPAQPPRTAAKPTDTKPVDTKPGGKTENIRETHTYLNSLKSKPELKLKVEDMPTLKDVQEEKDVKMETAEAEEHDEIIDEEEFLEEEEDYELDEEEFAEESEGEEHSKQRIMRPERMDEEPPSDTESHTEDGSLYDEIPSSDSEDLEDWFSLDIRAERAGDYLPLLGSKARSLLSAEKRRVSTRLGSLRHSLAALTESGRRQAEQLRRATMALAQLDDMLKAT